MLYDLKNWCKTKKDKKIINQENLIDLAKLKIGPYICICIYIYHQAIVINNKKENYKYSDIILQNKYRNRWIIWLKAIKPKKDIFYYLVLLFVLLFF